MSRNTYKQSFAHMGPGTITAIAVKAVIDLSVKNKSFMSQNTYRRGPWEPFAHMGPGTIAVKTVIAAIAAAVIGLSVKNKSFMSQNIYKQGP